MITMLRLAWLLVLAGHLGACIPRGPDDLTLVEVRPITPAERSLLREELGRSDTGQEIPVVAILASRTNLRRFIADTESYFSTTLVRCDGRVHIADRDPLGPRLQARGLWDDQGPLERSWPRAAPSIPSQGWQAYWLPLERRTPFAIARRGATGAVMSWYADHDLRQNADDVCAYVSGGVYLPPGRWRSNTVVIPYAAIRAALAAAGPPAVPHGRRHPPPRRRRE